MTHPQDTTSEVVAPAPSSDAKEVVLLPCPFCGGDAQLEGNGRHWFVQCIDHDECGAHGYMALVDAYAIEHWNTRATTAETQLAALTKRVGELEGALERKQDMLETLVSFVHRWTWEKEGNGTTDAERLDVIKHYPPISARRLTGGERQP